MNDSDKYSVGAFFDAQALIEKYKQKAIEIYDALCPTDRGDYKARAEEQSIMIADNPETRSVSKSGPIIILTFEWAPEHYVNPMHEIWIPFELMNWDISDIKDGCKINFTKKFEADGCYRMRVYIKDEATPKIAGKCTTDEWTTRRASEFLKEWYGVDFPGSNGSNRFDTDRDKLLNFAEWIVSTKLSNEQLGNKMKTANEMQVVSRMCQSELMDDLIPNNHQYAIELAILTAAKEGKRTTSYNGIWTTDVYNCRLLHLDVCKWLETLGYSVKCNVAPEKSAVNMEISW